MAEEKEVIGFDAEAALIGSILIEPESYARVCELVSESDFQAETYRALYCAAAQLASDGVPLDPLAITQRANENGTDVPQKTVAQLMEITPTAANDTIYAGIVAKNAKKRKLREMAEEILSDTAADPLELLGEVYDKVSELTGDASQKRLISSEEAILEFYDHISRREKGAQMVVPTGYETLDDILGGGMLKGGLYIIAARPGMGKTTVALNIADKINGPVLFISLEMSVEQITAKRTARLSGVPGNRLLMANTFTDDEYQKIVRATTKLSERQVYVNRRLNASVNEIGVMARSVKGLKAVFIDYLGLVRAENRKGSRYEQVTEISGALKRLAISLNVPVIAMSQLNRETEEGRQKRPSLSNLRDSGSIEQDADAVLLLYRDDYYDDGDEKQSKNQWDPIVIECNVAKNRHYKTGKVNLSAYLAVSRVVEAN